MDKQFAAFAMDQMIGSHSGHMANIDNNPLICGLFKAMGVIDGRSFYQKKQFVEALRAMADALDPSEES